MITSQMLQKYCLRTDTEQNNCLSQKFTLSKDNLEFGVADRRAQTVYLLLVLLYAVLLISCSFCVCTFLFLVFELYCRLQCARVKLGINDFHTCLQQYTHECVFVCQAACFFLQKHINDMYSFSHVYIHIQCDSRLSNLMYLYTHTADCVSCLVCMCGSMFFFCFRFVLMRYVQLHVEGKCSTLEPKMQVKFL